VGSCNKGKKERNLDSQVTEDHGLKTCKTVNNSSTEKEKLDPP